MPCLQASLTQTIALGSRTSQKRKFLCTLTACMHSCMSMVRVRVHLHACMHTCTHVQEAAVER